MGGETDMERGKILELLAGAEGYLSGEEVSRRLGVTRAAVWKEMEALRAAGWPIESAPRRGYILSGDAPCLSGDYLSGRLGAGSLFAGKIQAEEVVDSTNTRLKALGAAGAPEGTVVLAEEQTGGRGTQGRGFYSPRGTGLYLSALLRPRTDLASLFTLTGWAAVAVRRGIVRACGAPAEIKWLNDLYLNGRKLCGILTELSLLGESGEPDYVVVGVGVNVGQSRADFAAQGLEDVATSLGAEGFGVDRSRLCVCILQELEALARSFPHARAEYLADYRSHCLTPGRRVSFRQAGAEHFGTAAGVDERFALSVLGDDGTDYEISSGSVTLL